MRNIQVRGAVLLAGLFAFLAWNPGSRNALADVYIPVGQAKVKKSIIAFPDLKVADSSSGSDAATIHQIVANDLDYMDLFKFLGAAAFVEPGTAGITVGTFKMSDWSSIGAEFLIKGRVSIEGDNVVLEGHLYDVVGGRELLSNRYVALDSEVRTLAHTFANNIVETLTGLPGIFLTKIAMSCDRTGKKEIYMMDFDGTEVKQVTHHRSIAFAPAWSPDGTKLAYSLFTRHRGNIKNIDLFEFNFTNDTVRLLSNRRGINSGAAYSPDGQRIALTMSYLGNPDIFLLDTRTHRVTRLTRSLGSDVDPAWSPDGKRLAFVSSRTGMPMVFSTDLYGQHVQRLTYAGRYNATPSWSPSNNKITFAGWTEGHFDIFIMNPDGTTIERLTKAQGNNEDPTFSPDGNFIAFSSNRTGQKNIYVMNVDGTFVKRLTYGLGNCVSPKWSPPPPVTRAAAARR